MRKRVISWLLTVVMVVSMLPTSVLADTLAADQEQQTQQEQIAPADTENTVPAGNEETQEQQEPAEEVPVARSARSGGADSAPTAVTDADGFAEAADLPAPDAAYSLDAANTAVQPYALYRIEAALDGWQPLVLNGVQVFDAQQTVARLNLLPAGAAPASAISRTGEVETDIVTIPPHTLFAGNGGSGPAPEELLPGSVLNRIVVPKKITVHLGKPSANVRNVTVSFQSYIANVASSEVYPTWDSAPGTRRTSI